MQVKLLLVTLFEWRIACSFYRKTERMSNFFMTVRSLKPNLKPNFCILHIPTDVYLYTC